MYKIMTSLAVAGSATLPALAHHEDIPTNENTLLYAGVLSGIVLLAGLVVYFTLKKREDA